MDKSDDKRRRPLGSTWRNVSYGAFLAKLAYIVTEIEILLLTYGRISGVDRFLFQVNRRGSRSLEL